MKKEANSPRYYRRDTVASTLHEIDVLPVSGYAYVAPVPNRVYHCRYVAGSWVFRVRSLDTVQLDTDTSEQYNIGSQIPLQ